MWNHAKKINETAETANFADLPLNFCGNGPKWTKTMQTQMLSRIEASYKPSEFLGHPWFFPWYRCWGRHLDCGRRCSPVQSFEPGSASRMWPPSLQNCWKDNKKTHNMKRSWSPRWIWLRGIAGEPRRAPKTPIFLSSLLPLFYPIQLNMYVPAILIHSKYTNV